MTESQWLTCENTKLLWAIVAPKATDRQCRHFVEACCPGLVFYPGANWRTFATVIASDQTLISDATPLHVADLLREIFGNPFGLYAVYNRVTPRAGEVGPLDLFCDNKLCSDQFSEWLRWHNGIIPRIAQTIYGFVNRSEADLVFRNNGSRFFEFNPRDRTGITLEQLQASDLPILADALEEAGCSEWWLLSHLRGEEMCPTCMAGKDRKKCKDCHEGNRPLRMPHVRGCWALELFLERE